MNETQGHVHGEGTTVQPDLDLRQPPPSAHTRLVNCDSTIERTFAWQARFCRLARDYERQETTLTGYNFVVFASLLVHRFIAFMTLVNASLLECAVHAFHAIARPRFATAGTDGLAARHPLQDARLAMSGVQNAELSEPPETRTQNPRLNSTTDEGESVSGKITGKW